MTQRYVSCKETAVLVRKALTKAFPSQKFGVRSSHYAGGASISIQWIDGPPEKAVKEVVSVYGGKGFDGTIDMSYSYDAWLLPDDSAVVAASEGTTGSKGVYDPFNRPKPHPQAELVHFGAGYIKCSRELSNEKELRQKVLYWLADRWSVPHEGAHTARVGNDWLINHVSQEIWYLDFTQPHHDGQRVLCPVCGNPGTVHGDLVRHYVKEHHTDEPPIGWEDRVGVNCCDLPVPDTATNGSEYHPMNGCDAVGVQVTENQQLNGVEVKFTTKPDAETLSDLKAAGFRWSKQQGLWYARRNLNTLRLAYSLVGA